MASRFLAMRFDVITLFPEMFANVRDLGVTGRAHERNIWSLDCCNPRQFTTDIHQTVDDRPYGGGPGMVMLAEPLALSVAKIKQERAKLGIDGDKAAPVILLAPTGKIFNQSIAQEISTTTGAILVCGRYEGIDQRFIDNYVDYEISIGDYVLSGGELGAMIIIDSVIRLLPGVLHDQQSALQDSFSPTIDGLLDCPHYTRPEVWRNHQVPPVLLSGNHAKIDEWRKTQSINLTSKRRPDLLDKK